MAGSGSYIVRLSVRDLHGPTPSTLSSKGYDLLLCVRRINVSRKHTIVNVDETNPIDPKALAQDYEGTLWIQT